MPRLRVLYYSFSHYKLVPRKNSDFGSVIGVKNNQNELPTVFRLGQNYPNPFNPVTTIKYDIPVNSEITLKVYNILGQEVKTLVSGIQNRGRYEVKFDGTNLASGIYFYILKGTSLEGQNYTAVKKMVLVK